MASLAQSRWTVGKIAEHAVIIIVSPKMVRGTDAVKLGVATNTNEQVMAEYIVESVMATDTTVLERVIKTAK